MSYQLVVMKGRSQQSAIRLSPSVEMVVGRQDGCQIRVSSSQVSRKHCALRIVDGRLLVRDMGSSNGTFVDGRRLEAKEEAALDAGQVLTVGNIVFRVERQGAPAAGVPTGRPGDTAVAAAVAAETGGDYEIEADDQTQVGIANTAGSAEDDEVIELGEDDVADLLLDFDSDPKDKR